MSQLARRGAYDVEKDGKTTGNMRNGMGGGMNRAEKFEDEKKRFIESCFSKIDADGSSGLSEYLNWKKSCWTDVNLYSH